MKAEPLQSTVRSIKFFLNPRLLTDSSLIQKISTQLIDGNLVVIRNAFETRFAQRLYDCLDRFQDWKLYEDYNKNFHYHHHNIYDDNLFPRELARCREIFASEATKNFVQKISQRDCMGETTFSASLYLPGDHSLPHNDFKISDGEQRQVAFVWHLTKHWRDDWGGAFYWCKTGHWVHPIYNTLLLFNVDRSSKHLVTVVAPHAQGKRLAISGWWNGKPEPNQFETSEEERHPEEPLVEFI